MPEMQPVANTGYVPNPNQSIQTLSGILGIQQQRQALQTGQYQQQTAQAGAQQNQQMMLERQQLKSVMASGQDERGDSIYTDAPDPITGKVEPDPNKVIAYARRAMPLTGQAVAQTIIKTQADKLGLENATADLQDKYRNDLSGIIRSHINDPKATAQGIQGELEQYGAQNQAAIPAVHYANNLLNHLNVVPNPADRSNLLTRLSMQLQPAEATRTQQASSPASVQGPNGLNLVETNRFAPGGAGTQLNAAPIKQGLTPGERAAQITLPNNQVAVLDRATGQYRIVQGGGGTAPPSQPGKPAPVRTASDDAPPANAPAAVQQNFQKAAAAAQDHVTQIRSADEGYGNNVAISNAIRSLTKDAATGPGTQVWHHALGAVGVNSNNVANYQLLGAYLDRQAASMRTQMGLPATNEGVSTSQAIAGNTEYQRKAINDKNDYMQSLTEGLHRYRNGLDRVEGFTGNASPKAVQQFRSAWANNFDPDVFKAENAYKRSKAEGDTFVQSLTPQEAAQMAAKRANLKLLERGQLPQ